MEKKGKKGQIAIDKIVIWIIGLLVLVLIVVLYFILKSKGINMLDFVKNLRRFGG